MAGRLKDRRPIDDRAARLLSPRSTRGRILPCLKMVVHRVKRFNLPRCLVFLLVLILLGTLLKSSLDVSYRVCQDNNVNQSVALPRPTRAEPYQNVEDNIIRWGKAVIVGGKPRTSRGLFTIGLPTVPRKGATYLYQTLQSLVKGSTETERLTSTVVISLNSLNSSYVLETQQALHRQFGDHLESRFIQVINPPEEYYPSMTSLKRTFGDPMYRIKWRSKQNLDYAFLMHYCETLSEYYVQLEDDVIAAPGYLQKMKSFIAEQKTNWVMLDFSPHGFIGKLYKNQDLPKLASLIRMYYNEQPCDFLLLHFLHIMLQTQRFMRVPTLFKHMGYQSSLRNQTRDTIDVYFEGEKKVYKGDNPSAMLHTTIGTFRDHVIQNAYNNSSGWQFFWGRSPKAGDTILIKFNKPQHITRIVIDTGSKGVRKKDAVEDAILEYSSVPSGRAGNYFCDQYMFLRKFKDGQVDCSPNLQDSVSCLKVTITEDHERWLIIREIAVFIKHGAP